jgi:5'-nucleotidase
VLEEQWQRDANGNLPSRPFLRLGVSKGFTYTYTETPVQVPAAPPATGTVDTFEGEVTGMWLNGVAIDPKQSYSVTANAFLAAGGDNFRTFAQAEGQAQWGVTDLQAMVDYMAEKTAEAPLPVDYSQRAVEVTPVSPVLPGGELTLDIESFSMSHPQDVKDTEVEVRLGNKLLGSAALDNTVTDEVYDNTGKATVDVELPANTPGGQATLRLVGKDTGTVARVAVWVKKGAATVTAGSRPAHPVKGKTKVKVPVKVTSADGISVAGKVKITGKGFKAITAKLENGKVTITLPKFSSAGKKTLTVKYLGSAQLKQTQVKKVVRIFKK